MKKIFFLSLILGLLTAACEAPQRPKQPKSNSGVKEAQTTVQTDLNGQTIEQKNIIERLTEDNKPGSIKHLYVLSAYSGQVIIYSTVKGKVTSSGKRLTPLQVAAIDGQHIGPSHYGIAAYIGGERHYTGEVLQDDGSYGNSVEYIYWWDSKGIYHQQYITGGMILHISNQPLAVKNITINMELQSKSNE